MQSVPLGLLLIESLLESSESAVVVLVVEDQKGEEGRKHVLGLGKCLVEGFRDTQRLSFVFVWGMITVSTPTNITCSLIDYL